MLQEIFKRRVKVLFIDEFPEFKGRRQTVFEELKGTIDFIKSIEKHVEFLWMAPCAISVGIYESCDRDIYDELKNKFHFLELSINFRNSREIAQQVKDIDHIFINNKRIIAMPLENSPTGCTPLWVDTLEEGVKESRKITKEGILVIL